MPMVARWRAELELNAVIFYPFSFSFCSVDWVVIEVNYEGFVWGGTAFKLGFLLSGY